MYLVMRKVEKTVFCIQVSEQFVLAGDTLSCPYIAIPLPPVQVLNLVCISYVNPQCTCAQGYILISQSVCLS